MPTIMRVATLLLAVALSACNAAHGPVLDRGEKPANVNGTISGIVRLAGGGVASGRKVTAVNVATGARMDTTTATNGGYTMKLPAGKYRLEVELHNGERVTEQPAETEITASDLDAGRDFVIASR
jgi:Carboxypeptidase regulatory-like domain